MCDLPTGPALLNLAREVLLNDLLPLLPREAHLDARLVANSMAIAEREGAAGEGAAQELLRELESVYADATLTHPALRAGSTFSRSAGVGAERGEAGEGERELFVQLAYDLRAGAFEESEARERRARDVLWRLTIVKLRRANPRFLAANGFS
jgi:Domain of unknown function (DUF6285)